MALLYRLELALIPLLFAAQPLGADCPNARECHRQGVERLRERTLAGTRSALALFDRAVLLDADFAPGFAGQAAAHALLYEYLKAESAAREALRLDDRLAPAHAVLAFARLHGAWDRVEAERGFQRALELDPSDPQTRHWHAILLEVTGRHQEAVAEATRAAGLDPASGVYALGLGYRLYWARRYDQAIAHFRSLLARDPSSASARYFLGRCLAQRGDLAAAEEALSKASELSPEDWNVIAARGYLHALGGRRREARDVLRRLEGPIRGGYRFATHAASIHAALGESDEALAWLERALRVREGPLLWLEVDPRFDPLRSEPRFEEILAAVRGSG